MHLLFLLLLFLTSLAHAGPYQDALTDLGYEELTAAFDNERVNRLLGEAGRGVPEEERRAMAILLAAGAFTRQNLVQGSAPRRLSTYVAWQSGHPALLGRFDEPSLAARMQRHVDHDALLRDNVFIDSLRQALSDGIITGYDLRGRGVYDDFPAGLTFVYSQSSLRHMRQLVTLLAGDGVGGSLYITPKVSAFVFRDDWGEPSDAVVTLESGLRVVQGREIASMFFFDSRVDRDRFHQLVQRYAKKDSADESGLIADAWWQPFYYTDEPVPGFQPISLIVLSTGRLEATLTVLPGKTSEVLEGLPDGPWASRVDSVWVNPSFFRFLNGDYK